MVIFIELQVFNIFCLGGESALSCPPQ